MAWIRSYLFLLMIYGGASAEESNTSLVWSFRTDNVENENVRAELSSELWTQEIGDFSICFRYMILYFNTGNNGINIVNAKLNEEEFQLRVFNDKFANKFVIRANNETRQVIWFDAEVPVRQWNSICMIRNMKNRTFRIHQNNELVFSYGECVTIGQSDGNGFRVSGAPCANGGWKYNGDDINFVGNCTNVNWNYNYWCLVQQDQAPVPPDYSSSTNYTWGQCSLSCMDLSYRNETNMIYTHKFGKELFNKMQIGSGYDKTATLKGKIADLFIHEKAINGKAIDEFMNCKHTSIMDSANVKRTDWTLIGIGTSSLIEESIPQDHLCRRESFRKYIGFSELMDYEKGMRQCSSFGGRLPMSDDKKEEESLWETFEGKDCSDGIWMGISDVQQENQFLNVSRETYDNIFIYEERVGSELKEYRWMPTQPGGGVTENCVSSTPNSVPGQSWKDEMCQVSRCVACTIKANQFFKLRGLCKKTKLDTKYKIETGINSESNRHEFIGEYGWRLKWSEEDNGFKLQNSKDTSIYAVFNDTQEYPLGLRKWIIINDNCPTLKKQFLSFSSCSYDEFTCYDGSCIPQRHRCDIIPHCVDKSDEVDCNVLKLAEGGYDKNTPPIEKFAHGDSKIKVKINVNDPDILDIDYLKGTFTIRFWLEMQWVDSRITVHHLKLNKEKLLSDAEAKSLWVPTLGFVAGPDIARTVQDKNTFFGVIGKFAKRSEDLTTFEDPFVFSGKNVDITATRLYKELFTCQFKLSKYPFDSQICIMGFNVVKFQKDSVQLEPPENRNVTMDDPNVGEYSVTKIEICQQSKGFIAYKIYIKRSFWKVIPTTYLPTFCLLVLVHLTFYFPEDNFQVRATISLSCLLILSTLFGNTTRSLPATTQITFIEIWMMIAVLLTFMLILIHTIIGYIKELEKKQPKTVVTKVNSVGNVMIKSDGQKWPLSSKLNHYVGRIFCPIIFILCIIIYCLIAAIAYTSDDNDDEQNSQNSCK